MISEKDYRYIADDVYDVDRTKRNNPISKNSTVAKDKYIVIEPPIDNTSNGMQAMVVAPIKEGTTAEPDTSEIVIAYAGTNSGDGLDIATDVEMVAGGDTYLLADSTTKTFRKSQGKTALEYAQKISSKYPNSEITTTGHSLGESEALYVALKMGWMNVGYNGPDIHNMISDDEIDYMKSHPEQFRNYRNTLDGIGNITGNETKTAIYYDKVEGIYGPLKAHGLANWSFNKEGQVVDENGKEFTDGMVLSLAQTTVKTFQINKQKQQMTKGGLSSNEKIFLDAEQATVIASGLVSTAETALEEIKSSAQTAVEEAEELWNTTKDMPFGITELTEAELAEAYAEGGVTYESIVTKTDSHFDKKVAKAEELVTTYTTLKSDIQSGVETMLSKDSELAGDFKAWEA